MRLFNDVRRGFAMLLERHLRLVMDQPHLPLDWQEAVEVCGMENLVEQFSEQFGVAASRVGLTRENLYRILDFDRNDLLPGNFQANHAVVRSINTLSRFGRVTPLKRNPRRRSCDLLLARDHQLFVVEVFHPDSSVYRYPGHAERRRDLRSFLCRRAAQKLPQLIASSATEGVRNKLFLVVTDETTAVGLLRDRELEALASHVWENCGSLPDLWIGILPSHFEDPSKLLLLDRPLP